MKCLKFQMGDFDHPSEGVDAVIAVDAIESVRRRASSPGVVIVLRSGETVVAPDAEYSDVLDLLQRAGAEIVE